MRRRASEATDMLDAALKDMYESQRDSSRGVRYIASLQSEVLCAVAGDLVVQGSRHRGVETETVANGGGGTRQRDVRATVQLGRQLYTFGGGQPTVDRVA